MPRRRFIKNAVPLADASGYSNYLHFFCIYVGTGASSGAGNSPHPPVQMMVLQKGAPMERGHLQARRGCLQRGREPWHEIFCTVYLISVTICNLHTSWIMTIRTQKPVFMSLGLLEQQEVNQQTV